MNERSVAAYRRLVRAYPSQFRGQYEDDLVALFADQLDDESAVRVWMRATRDLSVTVPALHLEARMHRPSTNLVAVIASAVSVAALFTVVVIGSSVAVAVPALVIALGSGAVAVWAWRAERAGGVAAAGRRWWQLLVAGLALLATIAVVTTLTGDLDSAGWVTAMVMLLTSFLLMGMGLILGLVRLAGRRTRLAGS
jgi:hypothetical protein